MHTFEQAIKMTALLMVLNQEKSDVVTALKMKTLLWDNGIILSGLVLRGEYEGIAYPGFLEDIMQLKVIGALEES